MTMPAGAYYVGDLCFVVDDRWDQIRDLTTKDGAQLEGEFVFPSGGRFATYNVGRGDGEYQDQHAGFYTLHSGLIGCVRIQDIHQNYWPNIPLGRRVVFTDEFHTGQQGDVIMFGHIHIDKSCIRFGNYAEFSLWSVGFTGDEFGEYD